MTTTAAAAVIASTTTDTALKPVDFNWNERKNEEKRNEMKWNTEIKVVCNTPCASNVWKREENTRRKATWWWKRRERESENERVSARIANVANAANDQISWNKFAYVHSTVKILFCVIFFYGSLAFSYSFSLFAPLCSGPFDSRAYGSRTKTKVSWETWSAFVVVFVYLSRVMTLLFLIIVFMVTDFYNLFMVN